MGGYRFVCGGDLIRFSAPTPLPECGASRLTLTLTLTLALTLALTLNLNLAQNLNLTLNLTFKP